MNACRVGLTIPSLIPTPRTSIHDVNRLHLQPAHNVFAVPIRVPTFGPYVSMNIFTTSKQGALNADHKKAEDGTSFANNRH